MNQTKTICTFLKKCDLFSYLEEEHLQILAENGKIFTYEPQEFIFSTRDEAKNFYIVKEGEISLHHFSPERGSIKIETVQVGEIVGWSWLVQPYKWKFDCLTECGAVLISFDAKKIREEMENNYLFAYRLQSIFTKIIAERLHSTRIRLSKELGDSSFVINEL